MGPVMQGLRKPVNDLSRGCTVEDIVNTICVTGIQVGAVAICAVPGFTAVLLVLLLLLTRPHHCVCYTAQAVL